GSGDIGLIMARRMTLEGAKVKAVCELMPYSGGLARNIEQCLNDFNIPLRLSHTVVNIHGRERLEGVTIARVDENRRPIKESEEYIPCDTLLLSCGLIPENELTKGAGITLDRVTGGAAVNGERETEIEGIFACGNVLHGHDLVDYVSEESAIAGKAAAKYIAGKSTKEISVKLKTDGRVRYTVPQRLTEIENTSVYIRVADVYRDAKIVVRDGDNVIISKKKQRLAPAEMEKVELTKEIISQLSGNEISFSIEL
ncbi:MAG: FAD-dependent oxidoreductase, partial [Clostridia bacterium]|nr:FAD-dependent oxidoreductase [Clostridia bacterium]